ncbi:ribosome maturation factor RimM [Capsulimonas corticalis]|uniref:Ribosome maturation factor RimM n=1 Tax=Capsulimonas corticalis TaxID=2219043 RepID=A0A402CX84_9BACT|nr:ribosome maturation factor RimM [Capsulimonas corticalis]BDI32406.1 ribosome maturation factor RimM [Capsulimonas corticalis]
MTLDQTENTKTAEDFSVMAAQIAGAHGVSGNLRLRLIGANPEVTARTFQPGQIVVLRKEGDDAGRQLTVQSVRKQSQPKGAWIARFKEVNDRNEAEALFGHAIFIRETERPSLPEGEFYVDQLIGLSIVTDAGRALGKLTDVLNTPANDVYVTDKNALIPAVSEFVLSVDVPGGVITVRDVPGLLD